MRSTKVFEKDGESCGWVGGWVGVSVGVGCECGCECECGWVCGCVGVWVWRASDQSLGGSVTLLIMVLVILFFLIGLLLQ